METHSASFMTASVKYPLARWAVIEAVAALSDPEYQQRIWIRHELPHENYHRGTVLVVPERRAQVDVSSTGS